MKFADEKNVEFKMLYNSKTKKNYSIKLSRFDDCITIYVFENESKSKIIKVIRIKKNWLLKEILGNLS